MFMWREHDFIGEYWFDAWQRSILFLDVLRQRANNNREHNARIAPNALSYFANTTVAWAVARTLRRHARAADQSRAEAIAQASRAVGAVFSAPNASRGVWHAPQWPRPSTR